jgi:hypothetical protein
VKVNEVGSEPLPAQVPKPVPPDQPTEVKVPPAEEPDVKMAV